MPYRLQQVMEYLDCYTILNYQIVQYIIYLKRLNAVPKALCKRLFW